MFLAATSSHAQATAEDRAAAQALFDEGRSLIQAGRASEACPKFEESNTLDPGIGTQLNLADCYERVGKTASAWTLYVELATTARNAGQSERAAHAASRAQALKDKLSRLTIVVPEGSRIDGLTLRRGAVTVGAAQWGLGVPVDPGTHTVTASAPGKRPYQTTAEVGANGATATVTIPALLDAPKTEAKAVLSANGTTSPTSDAPAQSWNTQKTLAAVAGGVGVVGLGIGSFFGLRAMSKKDDAGCDGRNCTSPASASTYEDAQSAGTISTIAFIAGGVGLASGAILYFTAPGRGSKVHASVEATPGSARLIAGASF